MIPEKTDSRWKNIVEGNISREFKTVAAGLCVSRNQRAYRMDQSPATMSKCVEELISFFTKYEKISQDDLKGLFEQEE